MSSRNDRNSSARTTTKQDSSNSEGVPKPPRGWQRFKWLGPSFLWMLSAAGSGELLFTPRVAALYPHPNSPAMKLRVC